MAELREEYDLDRVMMERVRRIALLSGCVLIEGESGVGKTVLARTLHQMSPRKTLPIKELGCGEIHDDTIDALLFGHTKDAYSGAQTFQLGMLAEAENGTLILNDIDRLSLRAQGKLLRFLDDSVFFRLGEPGKPIKVDTRIVATTNKDLQEYHRQGLFLPDLYYRLKPWRIKVPALRTRPRFLREAAHHFLELFRRENPELPGADKPWSFNEDVYQLFLAMKWPDNLRGLRSAVESIALFGPVDKSTIELKDVIDILLDPDYGFHESLPTGKPNDIKHLRFILDLTGWNIHLTSRITGFSRTTIYKRIEEQRWHC